MIKLRAFFFFSESRVISTINKELYAQTYKVQLDPQQREELLLFLLK